MRERQTLPDMVYCRRKIPIADVAEALGIRLAGHTSAHCWREGHQNGDRTPSMSFKRNRARCFVCDSDWMSTIDLVIKYQELDPRSGLKQAVSWLADRWPVPSIAKNTKLARRERWATSPVGISSFPLEDFIRSGIWAALDDAGRALLAVMFCFAKQGQVSVSYAGLRRYTGKASNATIAKAFQQLKQFGILEALPKVGNNFRDAGRYRFTLDSPKFQAALSEVYTRLKLEIEAERELLAQSRVRARPETPSADAAYPGTVFTDSVKQTEVHVTKYVTSTFSPDAKISDESEPIPEEVSAENKETYESARYKLCKANEAISPNKIFESKCLESENPAETAPICPNSSAEPITKIVESSSPRIENKPSCESARFKVCNTKGSNTDFNFGWNLPAARGVN
jgi:hypothetical protein